jgi:hypothetical protein
MQEAMRHRPCKLCSSCKLAVNMQSVVIAGQLREGSHILRSYLATNSCALSQIEFAQSIG